VAKGTPVARMNTGIDGGMNRVFASKLPDGSTGLSEGGYGQGLSLIALSRAPGTIPSTVNPPRGPVTSPQEPLMASMAPAPASTRVASAAPSAQSDDGFFSSLARKVGFGAADTTVTAQPAPAKPRVIEAKRNETPPRPEGTAPKAAASKAAETKAAETKAAETKQAAARPPLKPSLAADPPAAAAPPAKDSPVAGSQPIMSANSFESRFSAVK